MNIGYVGYLKGNKKAERTIKNYTQYVQEMLDYVGKEETEINAADLNNWLGNISNLSSATVALKISAIKSYFEYLENMEIIDKNPASKIKRPAKKNKEKEYMSEEMVDKMIDCASCIRDKAILMMLKTNGLRINELINLTKDAYNRMNQYDMRYIKINAKGDKERRVFFTDELKNMIDTYLTTRTDDCDRLFVSHWGGPINGNNLSQTWKSLAKKAGIPFWNEISNHYFRMACASIYSEKGMPVDEIRDLLGHSNIAVTNTYLKTNPNKIYNTIMSY